MHIVREGIGKFSKLLARVSGIIVVVLCIGLVASLLVPNGVVELRSTPAPTR